MTSYKSNPYTNTFNSIQSLNNIIDISDSNSLIQTEQLKDTFISKLYYYFIHKGYFNIISTQIVNIVITIFLYSFLLFLINCVDYSGLFHLEESGHFSDYIEWNKILNLDLLGWTCFGMFCVFIICKLISLIDDAITFKRVKKFYNNRLYITDSQLASMDWESVVNKLKEETDCKYLDVYFISSKVMAKDNYLISLIDNQVLTLSYMTKLMEWNIMFCIINSIFHDNKVNLDLLTNKVKLKYIIVSKIKAVSIVNFLLMPIIVIFIFFYNTFKYGELFYNNPESIASRNWTLLSKWKFREYNELYHLFHERLTKSNKLANDYVNQFPLKIVETFARLILFVTSSIFLLFIFLTIINENLLINLNVTNSRPILWYIGILGSIIAITRSLIKNKLVFYPMQKMQDIQEIINYIPNKWIKDANKLYVKNEFTKLFEYQVISSFKEFFYIFKTPFDLWKISYNVDNIVDFFTENTIYESNLGYKCSDAIFNPNKDYDNDNIKNKIKQSFLNFEKKFPDTIDKHFYNQSIQINITNAF